MNVQRVRWWIAVMAVLPFTAVAQHAHQHASDAANLATTTTTADRSPNYSDGIRVSHTAMDMRDDALIGKLIVDQLEMFDGRDGNGQRWDVAGWYGNDIDRLRVRSEGEHAFGGVRDADIEALWSHAVSAFWDMQLGVRHDFGEGRARTWAAFGIEGLAPYGFDVAATGYVGASGRTAARVRVSYEMLFTQRLILEPELEANLYGKDDPARGIASGLSDLRLGLRLRYEVRRRFAPYVGVVWMHRFGTSAARARPDARAATDRQWVAGVRLWF